MNWVGWVGVAVAIMLMIEAVIIIPDKLPVIRRRRNGKGKRHN